VIGKYIYFDSGTTNTRIYYIEERVMKAVQSRKIGTIDNVASGDRHTLLRGLKDMYDRLLRELALSDADIDGIYMSGMATSQNGVHEVGYLWVPVGLAEYRNAVSFWRTPLFERQVGFLTGLVYRPDMTKGTLQNAAEFNNVRGEEIELLGIMETYSPFFAGKKTAVIMPGSHTHILYTEDQKIVEITSCMGGEMFAAMAVNTILSASVTAAPDVIVEQGLISGFDMVRKYGINRALYITRTLDLFTDESLQTRNSYLEGVINEGIITALQSSRRFGDLDCIAVAGSPIYFQIYAPLLSHAGVTVPCIRIEQNKNDSFALQGFLQFIK